MIDHLYHFFNRWLVLPLVIAFFVWQTVAMLAPGAEARSEQAPSCAPFTVHLTDGAAVGLEAGK